MTGRPHPDDLLIFAAIARFGGLTESARHLGRDAATLGRRIARLEQDLGAVLFAKSPRGYRLTDAGQDLLPQAEALEELMAEIDSGRAADGRGLTGRVRIGAPDGAATFLLPRVCAELAAENPGLQLDILASPRDMDLLGREVDIAITLRPPTAKGIECTKLADYRLLFATARFAFETCKGADPFTRLPLVGYMPELLIDPALDIPAELGLPAPVLRSNSVLVQWRWLRDGAGIGLIHDFTLAGDPGLIRLKPEFDIPRSYFIATRRADARFERMRAMRAALIARVGRVLADLHVRNEGLA